MKYNLYLNAVFESIEELSNETLSKILAPNKTIFSACDVSFKVEEVYRMSPYLYRVMIKVHGIKGASISDMINECGCNTELFINSLTDYIGIHIDGTQMLGNHKFSIEYTSFQI